MTEPAFLIIGVFTAAFLGAFVALAVGAHLHSLGCHKRPEDEGYDE